MNEIAIVCEHTHCEKNSKRALIVTLNSQTEEMPRAGSLVG